MMKMSMIAGVFSLIWLIDPMPAQAGCGSERKGDCGTTVVAPPPLAVVCVRNDTSKTIRYRWAWKDDDWETHRLESGETHSFRAENTGLRPLPFYVEYDRNYLRRGDSYFITEEIESSRNSENACIHSNTVIFQERSGQKLILSSR
jgi:hypothetical protein